MALLASGLQLEAQANPNLLELHAADKAVGRVGARLAAAGSDLCEARVASLGFALDDAARYAPPWRSTAQELLGSATRPVVIAVAQGGPAQRSGMLVGDTISGVNGWTVPGPGATDRVEAILDRIEQGSPSHEIRLDVVRGMTSLALRIVPVWACRTRFQVLPGGQLQGRANGTRVEIGSKLVHAVRGDHELAAVLAHELAHNILNHRLRLSAAGVFTKALPQTERRQIVYATEVEADRLAVYLCERAGFSLGAFDTVWGRLGSGGGVDHPPNRHRSVLLKGEIARVRAERAAGRVPRPLGMDAYLRPGE